MSFLTAAFRGSRPAPALPHALAAALFLAAPPAALLGVAPAACAEPPAGIQVENIGTGWQELVGVVELSDGRLIAWERAGRVWMVEADGTRHDEPMLDISDEVLAWRDHGLLGLALDPDFEANGFIYLAYVVDRHHLDYFGTPQYDPAVTTLGTATVARVTRYQADPAEGFGHIHHETRHVLLGATREDGAPIVHQSHGVGSLVFGEDGTLLMSMGESADYATFDNGGQMVGGYVNDGLASGILRPEDNIGAYRAQRRDSMNGKVLRLDPATGDGVPSNPFFDAAAPRAPRSRVWAMGLRNPFRMSRIPGTGAHLPSEGNPGAFVVSDVGWGLWEEVDLVEKPGQNFGWPVYEGHDRSAGYASISPLDIEAPNSLPTGGCAAFYRFRDLILQGTQAVPDWIHPCVSVQAESSQAQNADYGFDNLGYHGTACRQLRASPASWVQFPLLLPAAGSVLLVRYANGGDAVVCPVTVDGTAVGTVLLASTGSWTEWRLASVALPVTAGAHAVRISGPGTDPPAGAPVVAQLDCVYASADGTYPVVPPALRNGVHTRPLIDWPHGFEGARTSAWNLGAGVARLVGSPGGAEGTPFKGSCAIAAAPIALDAWPEQWRGKLWFADYAEGWIRAATLENGIVTRIDAFDQRPSAVVGIYPSAAQDAFYAVDVAGGLTRYRYAPTGNRPPVLHVQTSLPYGPAGLQVTFDASASTDPDGDLLRIEWDFGDGSPTQLGRVVQHSFAGLGTPAVRSVHLTVTDTHGAGVSRQLLVWPDNEPPRVRILSLQDGQLYPVDRESVYPLRALVQDGDHPRGVTCRWRTVLHHNTHQHPEPEDPACESTLVVSPLGCGTDTFWVTVELIATDPLGLEGRDLVRLNPDCTGVLARPMDLNHNGRVDGGDLGLLLEWWGDTAPASWQADFDSDGTIGAQDLSLMLAEWGTPRVTPGR